MRKILMIILCAVLFSAAFTGCSDNTQQPDNGKINIVAAIFPEYDIARAICKDRANITMLTPPGSSVHSFEPSPAEIISIQKADIFIYVGGESDGWVTSILETTDSPDLKVVRLMDNVDALQEEIKENMESDEDSDEIELDEHIWSSPKNAILLIDVILDAICSTDSENADYYSNNAKKYKTELEKINNEITELVDNAMHKKIVVADKFPFLYFVNSYGLDYEAAFPGCSDQSAADPKTINHLSDTVKADGLSYIFYAEMSNQSVANAVAEQSGAKTLLLNSCHNISKDDFNNGITYLDLMRQNIENLKKGLG